jgi:hypothetical protein
VYKWLFAPYPQAREQLRKAEEQIRKDNASLGAGTFFLPMLPAVEKVADAVARLERKIAALRCIEAIRLYAAAHDGQLPASLSDIKEVPIPRDPMTGKDFVYKVDGTKARLYAPPPGEGEPTEANTINYQLTLKKS